MGHAMMCLSAMLLAFGKLNIIRNTCQVSLPYLFARPIRVGIELMHFMSRSSYLATRCATDALVGVG